MFQSRGGRLGSEATALTAARVAALASRVASVEAYRRGCCAQRARTEEGLLLLVVVAVAVGVDSTSFEQRTEMGEVVVAVACAGRRRVEYEHAPVVARRRDTGCSAQVRVTPPRSMVVVVTVSIVRKVGRYVIVRYCVYVGYPSPLPLACTHNQVQRLVGESQEVK